MRHTTDGQFRPHTIYEPPDVNTYLDYVRPFAKSLIVQWQPTEHDRRFLAASKLCRRGIESIFRLERDHLKDRLRPLNSIPNHYSTKFCVVPDDSNDITLFLKHDKN